VPKVGGCRGSLHVVACSVLIFGRPSRDELGAGPDKWAAMVALKTTALSGWHSWYRDLDELILRFRARPLRRELVEFGLTRRGDVTEGTPRETRPRPDRA
jgi:hypothetical protein